MAHGRKGAPGSFGAPLDELLPKFGLPDDELHVSVDVHRRPAASEDESSAADQCRIFMLNQRLYEAAKL